MRRPCVPLRPVAYVQPLTRAVLFRRGEEPGPLKIEATAQGAELDARSILQARSIMDIGTVPVSGFF